MVSLISGFVEVLMSQLMGVAVFVIIDSRYEGLKYILSSTVMLLKNLHEFSLVPKMTQKGNCLFFDNMLLNFAIVYFGNCECINDCINIPKYRIVLEFIFRFKFAKSNSVLVVSHYVGTWLLKATSFLEIHCWLLT